MITLPANPGTLVQRENIQPVFVAMATAIHSQLLQQQQQQKPDAPAPGDSEPSVA